MKKLFTFIACALVALSVNAKKDLGLTNADLTSGWGSVYDETTKTITFEDTWKGRGWGFSSVDNPYEFYEYDYLVVEVESSEVPFKLVAEYTDGNTDEKGNLKNIGNSATNEISADAKYAAVKLNSDNYDYLLQAYIQNTKAVGKLVLKDAFFCSQEEYDAFVASNKPQKSNVSLNGWGKWIDGNVITYNADGTMTLSFVREWKGDSYWLDGKDASDFDYVVLEIAEPVEFQTQIWIEYSDGTSGEAFIEPGETSVKLELNESKKNNINQVAVQSSAPGTVTVKAVYFCTKEYYSSTGISNAVVAPQAKESKIYNLAGQQVGKSYKGIVIKNGKKVIQ